jgi:hypothetical protein
MGKPKVWRTLEELNADHERLCAEVEELKKAFEGHVHELREPMTHGLPEDLMIVKTTETPKKGDPFICAFCERLATEITPTCEGHRPQ